MKRNIIIIALTVSIFACLYTVLNMPASTKQCIDYECRTIKMPLYLKALDFIDRDLNYRRIAGDITAGSSDDNDRVIGIFNWVNKNIRKNPKELPVVDDHPLNIIIRGYGTEDQFQDVFTILCVYSGLPAFFTNVYNNARSVRYPLSFVKVDGKWSAFDPYYGICIKMKNGHVASLEDLMNDRSLIDQNVSETIMYKDIPYRELYYNLKPVSGEANIRPVKQMPIGRMIFEIKRAIKRWL